VGNQLIQVAYAGAVADAGTDVLTVPLLLPLRAALTASQAVLWDAPLGQFQIDTLEPDMLYEPGVFQSAVNLTFTEVY